MKNYSISVAFFLVTCPVFAQFQFTPELETAYNDFLKLKVKTAQKIVSENLQKVPNNGIAIYLENYSDIIYLLTSEDKELYDKMVENEGLRLKKIKALDSKSPYFLFTQAEIRFQWALVKLKFGENTSAAFEFQKAYKLLKENEQKFPDFLPNKKTHGLLQILIGNVPEKYNWLVSLLGLKGEVIKGIKELNEIRRSKNIYNLEAELLYQTANFYVLKHDKESLDSLQKLYYNNNDNLLFCFVYCISSIKRNQSEAVLQLLHNCPKTDEYIPIYFFDYLKAEVYLQKANYPNAIFYYHKYLKFYKGSNFLKDSYYKLFLSNWLQTSELNKNLPYLDKVLKEGNAITEADKYAQKFAQRREFPDPLLMKARLSFDGGYYEQSFALLKINIEKTFKSQKDKAEYNYRLGRLYHKTNDISEAIKYYERTIVLSETGQYYFGANACLQLGYLYREKGDKIIAKMYFEKALTYKNHEYKNSIDNQAKSALKEMSERKEL